MRCSKLSTALGRHVQLRGLLRFKGTAQTAPLEEVEPAKDIVRRFVTGGTLA